MNLKSEMGRLGLSVAVGGRGDALSSFEQGDNWMLPGSLLVDLVRDSLTKGSHLPSWGLWCHQAKKSVSLNPFYRGLQGDWSRGGHDTRGLSMGRVTNPCKSWMRPYIKIFI